MVRPLPDHHGRLHDPRLKVRSKGYTRAGDGYAAFAVQGWGDPGRVSVEVVMPKQMEFNSTAPGFTATTEGKRTTWRLDHDTEEGGIWSYVSARDPSRVSEREVPIGDDTVAIQSFPATTPGRSTSPPRSAWAFRH